MARERMGRRTPRERPDTLIGVRRGRALEPVDRRVGGSFEIVAGDAADGSLVRAEVLRQTRWGPVPVRILEDLGPAEGLRAASRMALALHAIPTAIPPAAEAEAVRARGVRPGGGREDLRDLALVTIDGEDARDFDDAVFAEPTLTGHRLVVAIADVAHYVRAGSALDAMARERGNSVYFPDLVVPMLPEALSNHWCSLRPDEARFCLFVEMTIDAGGRKTGHRFGRGIMKSHARLTYEAAQRLAVAGADARVGALFAAWRALDRAREQRGALDLDLPEREALMAEDGGVLEVRHRERLDSHRVIEAFMVLANVAAAEELTARRAPCVFRIHAPPSPEKLDTLRGVLKSFAIALPAGNRLQPRDLDRALHRAASLPESPLIHETMLRSLSRAEYAVENIGHFGLALAAYAHFTSPIRRYADLLVHRALIAALGLGQDGEAAGAAWDEIASHITLTERRAALAERDAMDRLLAAYLSQSVGAVFAARISGVTRAGIFVTLATNGASGLIPVSTLPHDHYRLDEATQSLVGQRGRRRLRLADRLDVVLVQAVPLTGSLTFMLAAPASERLRAAASATDHNAPEPAPEGPGAARHGVGKPRFGKSRFGKSRAAKLRAGTLDDGKLDDGKLGDGKLGDGKPPAGRPGGRRRRPS